MSTEDNKAVVRGYIAELSKGNLAIIDELLSADFVDHDALPGVPAGREGIKRLIGLFYSAFSDLQFSLEEMLAEGDKVVVRGAIRGTHTGTFQGMPATGRRISVGAIDIWRVVDGKQAEHWGFPDRLGMMQQLGAMPAPQVH
jgi:steroid delta-isomerase-like uncharacterized protein